MIERFGIYRISHDPTMGSEIGKTRPCLVISPDEMNRHVRTVIVAPMTTTRKRYPTRVSCTFAGKQGEVVLDQIRTVDRSRLLKQIGRLDRPTATRVVAALLEMFA
ncbi:MAG: type II toxin-antitoxin system PemK/MazF family toxin [Tepidisphaeraceae bacterium]